MGEDKLYSDGFMQFKHIKEVLELLPYGHPIRIMFQWYGCTGANPLEIDRMRIDNLVLTRLGWMLSWRAGKQKKNRMRTRREIIPTPVVREYFYYRNQNKTPNNGRLFNMKYSTLRRNFTRDIRPRLSRVWQQKSNIICAHEYTFNFGFKQIKQIGIFSFIDQLKKYHEQEHIAPKKYRTHIRCNFKYMTGISFLSAFDNIKFEQFNKNMTYCQIFNFERQTELT